METTKGEIIVKYQTSIGHCKCCGQNLENPKISGIREFTLTKESFLDWTEDWNEIAKYDALEDVIEEFVYETIQFFATSFFEEILIENSEFYKVKHFVLREVIKQ